MALSRKTQSASVPVILDGSLLTGNCRADYDGGMNDPFGFRRMTARAVASGLLGAVAAAVYWIGRLLNIWN